MPRHKPGRSLPGKSAHDSGGDIANLRNDRRSLVANLAARMMAEDGIINYAIAKNKAARQAGLKNAKALPDNREIEKALRTYQAIFHAEQQSNYLRLLRHKAVDCMRLLADFDPHLTGAVLTGTASLFTAIELQLFVDDSKTVELFLINRGISYRAETRRIRVGSKKIDVPVLNADYQEAPVSLTVYPVTRAGLAPRHGGQALGRARLNEVEALLGES